MEKASVVVIGAGVVGCALARAFSPGRSVVVLEALDGPGRVTSRFNSGVIHSGIHLPPGTLKARFAVRGKQLVEEQCARQGVPFRKVGMHVLVARDEVLELWTELGRLVHMFRRAGAQHIPVRVVDRRAVRKREPCVDCLFGLFIPEVGIIDQQAFVASVERDAAAAGAQFAYGQRVCELARDGGAWRVVTGDREIAADCVVNAAGLAAADVAKLAGFEYRQFYYRGEYYEIDGKASGLQVRGLVYPVHRPGKPGLGVHLTATVDGRILVGPNARAVPGPEWTDRDPTPVEQFHHDAVKYLPGLKVEHMRWAYAGIRPKPTDAPGEQDFVIAREPGPAPFVNLIGIESPGFTAALAIAEHVHETLERAA